MQHGQQDRHLGCYAEVKAGALLVTALDEVAWLLNLRGGDVAHNPVFISYAVVTTTSAAVYLDSAKASDCFTPYKNQLTLDCP